MKRAVVAVLATLGLVLGGTQVWAAVTGTQAACSPSPAVTDSGTTLDFSVACSVPKPAPETVTATATVTATVTATPDPAPATSAPPPPATTSAAPSPTIATTTAPASTFPDASSTGVPAGTTLTAYTGPTTISTAGTVISGKLIKSCIQVTAPRVTIRNSKITCTGPAYATVSVDDGAFDATDPANRLLLVDTEVVCVPDANGNAGTGIGEAGFILRRVNLHGCENGGDINQNVIVEDSFIHDLWNYADNHSDGLQFANHLEAGKEVKGTRNVTIQHSTIYSTSPDGTKGTSAIIGNLGGDKGIVIDGNLLGGGAYTLYCQPTVDGDDFKVTNNHFSRTVSAAFGPSTECSDATQSGNVWHETGAPLNLP